MKPYLVYMTTADTEEAKIMACALVEERLAACVNVLGRIDSVYRWQGEVHEAAEVSLVAKTSEERLDALIARVVELHSYECPCVVAIPIQRGFQPFLHWIDEQTSQPF